MNRLVDRGYVDKAISLSAGPGCFKNRVLCQLSMLILQDDLELGHVHITLGNLYREIQILGINAIALTSISVMSVKSPASRAWMTLSIIFVRI